MNLDYDRLYNNIFKRVSTRSFSTAQLDNTLLSKIKTKADNINNISENMKIHIIDKADDNMFTGIIGSYGRVQNARSCAVFVGKKDVKDTLQELGYYGELFILDLLSDNIGTCWISGTFNKANVLKNLNLTDDYEIYAITPLGIPAESETGARALVKTLLKSKKRKDISEISNLDSLEITEDWMKTVTEAVRVAPSAMNVQPWYLIFSQNQIILRNEKGSSGKFDIDIGIAKSHLEIGLSKCNKQYSYAKSTSTNEIIFKII